jgi:hypothetical protein
LPCRVFNRRKGAGEFIDLGLLLERCRRLAEHLPADLLARGRYVVHVPSGQVLPWERYCELPTLERRWGGALNAVWTAYRHQQGSAIDSAAACPCQMCGDSDAAALHAAEAGAAAVAAGAMGTSIGEL